MFSELALPLGFLRLKQRLPFAYDLGTLVYPTIETAEENRMSKRPHAASRGTERYIAPKGRGCGGKNLTPVRSTRRLAFPPTWRKPFNQASI